MKKSIPIVILTRDEPCYLKLMIKSIKRRTRHPYKLFIVDNCSVDNNQIEYISELQLDDSLVIIKNPNNNWVLGFNLAIKRIELMKSIDQDCIVLSDGDIIVPLPCDNICWLQFLKNKFDLNTSLGKIGLSLDVSGIKNKTEFKNTLYNEKRYMQGPKIDDLIIAPVDTTLAIYRKDLYVTGLFKMQPGHASLVKPYYYVVRTDNKYNAKHLGWKSYSEPSKAKLIDKILCFTKYSGYIDPILLKKVGFMYRFLYIYLGFFCRIYWILFVIYYWILYLLPRFPRGLNEIQSSRR